jgi:hypothetical protein
VEKKFRLRVTKKKKKKTILEKNLRKLAPSCGCVCIASDLHVLFAEVREIVSVMALFEKRNSVACDDEERKKNLFGKKKNSNNYLRVACLIA